MEYTKTVWITMADDTIATDTTVFTDECGQWVDTTAMFKKAASGKIKNNKIINVSIRKKAAHIIPTAHNFEMRSTCNMVYLHCLSTGLGVGELCHTDTFSL
jgi:hypothetical protein